MLRITLAVELLLIGLYVAVPYFVSFHLPRELEAYLARGSQQGWAPTSAVNSVVSIPLTVVHVIAAVALWFFRGWARLPYLISSVWAFIGVLFGGPPVQHVFEYSLEEAWIFVSGASCALSYYAGISWHGTSKA